MNGPLAGTDAPRRTTPGRWLVAVPLALAGLVLAAAGLLTTGMCAWMWWQDRSTGSTSGMLYIVAGTPISGWSMAALVAGQALLGLALIGAGWLLVQSRDRHG